MSTRIYAVALKFSPPDALVRLVRAANPAQALRHVARDTLIVKVAGQDELVFNTAAGVKVETAGDETD